MQDEQNIHWTEGDLSKDIKKKEDATGTRFYIVSSEIVLRNIQGCKVLSVPKLLSILYTVIYIIYIYNSNFM